MLVAITGFAVSSVVTTLGQQKDKVDPPISEQRDLLGIPNALEVFGELSGKLDDAYNNKDAEAAAALFTEDAALVTPDGMIFGRQAIQKRFADTFQRWPITGFLSRRERLQLNAIDNAVWSVGEWSGTLQSAIPGSPVLPALAPAGSLANAPSQVGWPETPRRFRHRTG